VFLPGGLPIEQVHGLQIGESQCRPGEAGEAQDQHRRQQVFMASMADKMLSTGVLTNPQRINDLMSSLKAAVVLDDEWDILAFAKQAKNMTGGNMTFQTIPTTGLEKIDREEVVTVDKRAVQRFIRERSGQQPTTTGTHDSRGSGTAPVTVDVLNAAKVTGLANKVLETLEGRGFTAGTSGNSESPLSESVVRHTRGDEAAADRVAQALGGLPIEVDTNVPLGRVRVFLAKDYDGPTGTSRPSARVEEPDGEASAPRPPDEPKITADGVTCVN
jgi:hypothetical protein